MSDMDIEVGGRDIEASEGSGLAKFSAVSAEDVKAAVSSHTERESGMLSGTSVDDSDTEETTSSKPASISKADADLAYASFAKRYPDSTDPAFIDEMADAMQRHEGLYGVAKDRGELVATLEHIYGSVHGGVDLGELSQAAKDDVLDEAETHFAYTDDAVGAVESLVSKLGPDDERVSRFLDENDGAREQLAAAHREHALDSSVSAIGSFLDGKSKEARAYQASPQLQAMTQEIIHGWDLDPALLLEPATAVDIYKKAIRSGDEIISAKRTGEETLIVPGDGGIAELREVMFRTQPDALAELNATSAPYPEPDWDSVWQEGGTIDDITQADVRAGIKSHSQQSSETSAEIAKAFMAAKARADRAEQERGTSVTSTRLGV